MAKSAWIKHVAAFRAAHKGMDPKIVFGEAAKTFKKQSGGSALSPLSPEAVSGMQHSGGTALQMKAAQYSGGKSKKSRSKKSRSRSHKRRH